MSDNREPWLFPPARASRLESRDRAALLPWEKIALALGPGPGMAFGDLGAGPGIFCRKLLETTRGQGRFAAVDSQEGMLELLRRRRSSWMREGVPGASLLRILAAPKEPGSAPPIPLADSSLDRALLIHLLHEIKDIPPYLRDLRRVMRPWGRALIIDWAAAGDPHLMGQSGPPLWSRISRAKTEGILRSAGFSMVREVPGFPHGWALLVA